MSIARFLHINRSVPGYYFEFGCNEANTMQKAWDHFQHLFDFTYVGFDSFEGLPEIAEVDEQPIWEQGKLAFAEERFIKLVHGHGMPVDKLRTVKGFYCDLYMSTVPVLAFIVNFLQVGTVIVFDDWYCFHGDSKRGVQLAMNEFRQRHPELRFSDFVRTN